MKIYHFESAAEIDQVLIPMDDRPDAMNEAKAEAADIIHEPTLCAVYDVSAAPGYRMNLDELRLFIG